MSGPSLYQEVLVFDDAYLDTMNLGELLTLQDGCEQSAQKYRRAGCYGLAQWWIQCSHRVGDAIIRCELSASEYAFAREQLPLPMMPPRVSPESR